MGEFFLYFVIFYFFGCMEWRSVPGTATATFSTVQAAPAWTYEQEQLMRGLVLSFIWMKKTKRDINFYHLAAQVLGDGCMAICSLNDFS